MPLNNFDFVRLIAAITVIIGHSIFVLDLDETEIIGYSLGVRAIHGSAVNVFFTLSGYLICKSYVRNPDIRRFLKNRCLRIFPGLIFSVLITYILICPLFTSLAIGDYFLINKSYLLNAFLYFNEFKMHHVFDQANDVNYVNRSLWTLKHEFSLYLVVLLLGLTRVLNTIMFPIIYTIYSLLNVYLIVSHQHQEYYNFIQAFLTGMLFFWLEQRLHFNIKKIFFGLILVYITSRLCIPSSMFRIHLLEFLLPLLALTFSLQNYKYINQASKFGDFSYGIYLYGYPVQQALSILLKNTSIVDHLYIFSGISILISFLFAFISWHLVEKVFLRWKMP